MNIIASLINVLLHLDKYLTVIIKSYGIWTYALIFLIIFCETGLVITPFVSGIGEMNYPRFITYNMLGAFLWVSLFLGGGYFFGNLPFIKAHFSYILIAIILISVVPGILAFIKEKRNGSENDVINTAS